jgi:hypothetical protein
MNLNERLRLRLRLAHSELLANSSFRVRPNIAATRLLLESQND